METTDDRACEWLAPDGLAVIEAWARNGVTDADIAHNMGLSKREFVKLKKENIQMQNILKKGKVIADAKVENALYKRAIGYRYTETTTKLDPFGRTIYQTVKECETVPDVNAQAMWLKARKPEVWADKRDDNADNRIRFVFDSPPQSVEGVNVNSDISG